MRRPAADHLGDLRGQRDARQPERDRPVRHRLAEPGRLSKLQFNCAEANAMLDQLGYKKGADGIRVAPATTGKYAQPAHPMQYQIMVPNSLDFNGSREFSIVQDGFAKAGVKVTQQAGGDSDAAARDRVRQQLQRGQGHRLRHASTSPCGTGSRTPIPTSSCRSPTATSGARWSDTGLRQPRLQRACTSRRAYRPGLQRKTLVAKMDKLISDQFIYTFLVNEEAISASLPKLGRVPPRAERLQLRLHDGALPEVRRRAERGAERKRNEWKDEPTTW